MINKFSKVHKLIQIVLSSFVLSLISFVLLTTLFSFACLKLQRKVQVVSDWTLQLNIIKVGNRVFIILNHKQNHVNWKLELPRISIFVALCLFSNYKLIQQDHYFFNIFFKDLSLKMKVLYLYSRSRYYTKSVVKLFS